MIRGVTKNISFGGAADKDSDPTEVIIPFHIDKRNGVTTDQGGWKRRPGFAEKWDLGESSSVTLLIPEYGGYAATRNGKVFTIGDTPARLGDIELTGIHRPYYVWYRTQTLSRPIAIIVDGGRTVKISTQPNEIDYLGGAPVKARFAGVIDTRLVLAGHNDLDFVWSDLENPESFPAANFNTVAGDGEAILNFKISERLLYFFKTHSVEIWINLGTDFGRRNTFKPGLNAPDSLISSFRNFYWYADDGDFYMMQSGQTPEIISGQYTSYLREIGDLGSLYGIDFHIERVARWFAPQINRCFVYDYAHRVFSEDNQWNGDWMRMPILSYMEQSPNSCYVGDYNQTGKIYHWSWDYKTDNGNVIRSYRKFVVPMTDDGGLARANRLRLRLKRGQATTGRGKALVAWRIDGGDRYTEDIDLGTTGENDPYADIWNLGVGKEIELEFVESEPDESIIAQAFLTSEQLGG